MTKAWLGTVRILINPHNIDVNSQAAACDWMSGLLSENPQVLDWGYLPTLLGDFGVEPYQLPKEVEIDFPKYQEGDAFNDTTVEQRLLQMLSDLIEHDASTDQSDAPIWRRARALRNELKGYPPQDTDEDEEE